MSIRRTPVRRTRLRRPSLRLAAVATASLLALTACGGGGFDDEPDQSDPDAQVSLDMLIASSGDAEANAVKEAVSAWEEETGNTVTVTVASDMNQELAQGFAGGNPPDVFYLDATQFANYAQDGSLLAYADEIADADDFYETLRDTFTYDDEFVCAPKDFGTLALQINTAAWEEAGLTEDDVPTTWEELRDVAGQLTTGDQTGLVLTTGIDRAGAFVVQNGGWWLNDDGTEATADTPEVKDALAFLQEMADEGSLKTAQQVDAGWGGEAFGTGRAAMTIEGNWIDGAMTNDYPDVDYLVTELPEGPAGQGTLTFTQCWGIAADSQAQSQAVDLVDALTTPEQQLEFSQAFGVMPSRQAAADGYEQEYPQNAAFIAGGDYGQGPITAPGMDQVIADINSKLESFGRVNLDTVLAEFDDNADAVLGQ